MYVNAYIHGCWPIFLLAPNGTSVSTVTCRAQVRSTRLLTKQDDLPPQTYMRTIRYLQIGPLDMKLTIQNPPAHVQENKKHTVITSSRTIKLATATAASKIAWSICITETACIVHVYVGLQLQGTLVTNFATSTSPPVIVIVWSWDNIVV